MSISKAKTEPIATIPPEFSQEIRSLGLQGVPVPKIVKQVNRRLASQGRSPVSSQAVQRHVRQAQQTAFAEPCFAEVTGQDTNPNAMMQTIQERLRTALLHDMQDAVNNKDASPASLQRLVNRHKHLNTAAKRQQRVNKVDEKARAEEEELEQHGRFKILKLRKHAQGELSDAQEEELKILEKKEIARNEREESKPRKKGEKIEPPPRIVFLQMRRTIQGIMPFDLEQEYRDIIKRQYEESKDNPKLRFSMLLVLFSIKTNIGASLAESEKKEWLQLDAARERGEFQWSMKEDWTKYNDREKKHDAARKANPPSLSEAELARDHENYRKLQAEVSARICAQNRQEIAYAIRTI